jgi:aspartyl/asparaginyl beta-hydroxylase (cupin superfamily)
MNTSSLRQTLENRVAYAVLNRINAFFDRAVGGSNRPAVFRVAEFPALANVTAHWRDVQAEADALLVGNAAWPRYHELDPHMSRIAGAHETDKSWRVFLLHAMGENPAANQRLCPRTTALLQTIPGLYQAFFSLLDAGKSVPSHEGPYRGYLRYHLGLRVPALAPPHLRVRDVTHTWTEGGDFLFDDSLEHEVINPGGGPRVILIIDILRPLPPLYAAVNRWFVRHVIARLYARRLMKNLR